jgi:hypothetical protein
MKAYLAQTIFVKIEKCGTIWVSYHFYFYLIHNLTIMENKCFLNIEMVIFYLFYLNNSFFRLPYGKRKKGIMYSTSDHRR